MVISGGNFKPDTLKPKEVVSLLLDDEELEKKRTYSKYLVLSLLHPMAVKIESTLDCVPKLDKAERLLEDTFYSVIL